MIDPEETREDKRPNRAQRRAGTTGISPQQQRVQNRAFALIQSGQVSPSDREDPVDWAGRVMGEAKRAASVKRRAARKTQRQARKAQR